jgi:carbon storage regulator
VRCAGLKVNSGESCASTDKKTGESLKIGDSVTITVLDIKPNQVRVGVDARKNVAVQREEIFQRIQAGVCSRQAKDDAESPPVLCDDELSRRDRRAQQRRDGNYPSRTPAIRTTCIGTIVRRVCKMVLLAPPARGGG